MEMEEKGKKEMRARENAATMISLLDLEPESETQRKLNLKVK